MKKGMICSKTQYRKYIVRIGKTDVWSALNSLDHFRWHPGHDSIGGDIPTDNGTGGNHGIFAHRNTRQNGGPCSYPGIAFDHNWPGNQRRAVSGVQRVIFGG